MSEIIKLTDFDRQTVSSNIQMMKAMIPYASPGGQRFLSLYAKVMELRNTMGIVQQFGNQMSICEVDKRGASPMEMLTDLREYCSADTRSKLDEITNAFAMMQMFELMRDSEEE